MFEPSNTSPYTDGYYGRLNLCECNLALDGTLAEGPDKGKDPGTTASWPIRCGICVKILKVEDPRRNITYEEA